MKLGQLVVKIKRKHDFGIRTNNIINKIIKSITTRKYRAE